MEQGKGCVCQRERNNRRSHPGSHLIVLPLAAVQMGRLTPVSIFKSSNNGVQLRWAAGNGSRPVQSNSIPRLRSLVSAPFSTAEERTHTLALIMYTDRFTKPQRTQAR